MSNTALSRDAMKALLRKHGGSFHGPNVETLSMEEQAFWRFMDDAIMLATATPISEPP